MELPGTLQSGEVARLFPVISDSGKEQRAASILLSVISAVPPFADAIFSQIGQRIGARSTVNTFTEVVFKNEDAAVKKDRPDGLIEIVTGKRRWTALVEAKIGNSDLESNQIERYLRLARDNSIDAVITISNQFSARPTHSPVAVNKQLLRRVSLFHSSWMSILTSAVLLQERAALNDPEQAFLLREFIRFFSHPSAGLSSFSSMPPEWTLAVQRVQAGGKLSRGEQGESIVESWHQELRDLSLMMSRVVGCEIETKLSRTHASDADRRLRDDVATLCSDSILRGSLEIPGAASELVLVADLKSRSFRTYMSLAAPKERKSSKGRVNWLLRQLRDVEPVDVSINVDWASRAQDSIFSLTELRENPDLVNQATNNSEIRGFEIILTSKSAKRFTGRRTFIEELETLVPRYYELIGQHLQRWIPSPPKPKHSVAEIDVSEELESVVPNDPQDRVKPHAGNFHSDLLEIPGFLVRSV